MVLIMDEPVICLNVTITGNDRASTRLDLNSCIFEAGKPNWSQLKQPIRHVAHIYRLQFNYLGFGGGAIVYILSLMFTLGGIMDYEFGLLK